MKVKQVSSRKGNTFNQCGYEGIYVVQLKPSESDGLFVADVDCEGFPFDKAVGKLAVAFGMKNEDAQSLANLDSESLAAYLPSHEDDPALHDIVNCRIMLKVSEHAGVFVHGTLREIGADQQTEEITRIRATMSGVM